MISKSLKKKLKYGKLLLSNEKKPSLIIDELKRIYAYNRAKKKKQLEATFIDSTPNKIINEDSDDYIPVVNLNKKEKTYYYQIFIKSIENLLFSVLLYVILIIVVFPTPFLPRITTFSLCLIKISKFSKTFLSP